MLKLVIQDDEGKTTVVPLVRDEITIGREEGNTIRLTERNVSRHHARLCRANGAVTIEDLESYNGVRINGNIIDGETSLAERDRVQIGDYLIELRSEDVERADSEQATQRIERLDPSEMAAGGSSDVSNGHTVPLPKPKPKAKTEQAPAAKTGAPDPAAPARSAAPPSPPAASAAASQPRMPAADRAEATDSDAHGKLVVLSTSFAGKEFLLDKSSVVIGRTEDNDICVDHRSISRHHAKIVREDGRYAVVDLQSSNGVRVNGEEYGKVELRRGDVVDLGHVRMRYVEGGEDFVFGRDAQPVDLEAGRRRGFIWAIAAVFVIGGGTGVYALTSGSGGGAAPGGEDTRVAVADDDATGDEAIAPVQSDAATEREADGEDDADRVRTHIEAATDAVADDRWDEALDEARAALVLDSDDERALALATQAETELENRERYERFRDAVEAGDFRAVATSFAEIDRESVYRVKGQPEHDRMRDDYVQRVERRARLAARRGQCDQLQRIARDARTLWPAAGDAAAGVPCRQAVAQASPDTSSPDPAPPEEDNDAGGGSESTPSAGSNVQSVDEVVEEAQAAAREGEFGRALRLCEDALRRSRGHSEALMVCLISACNLRNVSKAKRYMSQISGDRRIYARQICLRHGVDVE